VLALPLQERHYCLLLLTLLLLPGAPMDTKLYVD
jgi:hypothetical protein